MRDLSPSSSGGRAWTAFVERWNTDTYVAGFRGPEPKTVFLRPSKYKSKAL
ncbi:hypothetical protein F441_17699 [Phytophthora nicotianae CJ01A1]|uniref:Uncharacterized protein n=6 Tax=Phytophthora nicotianae TaxID=4792 RepID=W2R1W1_PHYN3|nr:hypothetical protein PPTG_21589 [Phytophthora nicotianae INRA-310]ETI35929.1 hypothetical protein F443_17825 [Phytophthora nicotianae P1569]ETK76179.1 hypothetical protein L915_17352 [Phytophthora nicotianae]ETO64652.1 hypothetical protein F444_17862 [Phytophthora nicotianae P1976]ETP05752.1 hypothetical protein F441_17699 [Phytophthora nicotianae CJ01A1]ETP33864.1 hypothetical protein F442_17680 [Phytophthora nicotianae P10297]